MIAASVRTTRPCGSNLWPILPNLHSDAEWKPSASEQTSSAGPTGSRRDVLADVSVRRKQMPVFARLGASARLAPALAAVAVAGCVWLADYDKLRVQ